MNRRLAGIVTASVIVIPLLTYFLLRFGTHQKFDPVPTVYTINESGDSIKREIPDFVLWLPDSVPVNHDSLIGKLVYIDFFSVRDTLKTKVLHGHLKRIYDNVEWDRFNNLLFLSINTGDSPEELAAYRKSLGVDLHQWMIVSADEQEIFKLGADGLGIDDFSNKSPGSQPFTCAVVTLVDKAGVVRKYYQGYDLAQLRKMEEDMITLFRLEYPEELGNKPAAKKAISQP